MGGIISVHSRGTYSGLHYKYLLTYGTDFRSYCQGKEIEGHIKVVIHKRIFNPPTWSSA